MTDNVTANAGSGGETFGSDDISGVQYPRIKLIHGADGTNDGDVSSANPLPVDASGNAVPVTDNGGSLTVDGTVSLSATDNAVLDTIETNTDYGAVVGGGAEATALRVTLANDSTGVLSVDDGGGALTVDGTVTANLSATDNAVLDTIETNTDFGTTTGGGTESGALRVTLANNSTGVVSVDDNGGSLTVDSSDLSTLAGAVSGSEMQADIVAALPTGSNLVGDVGLSGARTSGGTTAYRNIDVDEFEDEIKGSAGQVYWIHAVSIDATPVYLHLYNATAANVTVGTTTPHLTFLVPTQGDSNGAGFTLSIPNGVAFGTAITIAATTTVGGSTGPGANEVIVNLGYA